MKRQQQMQPGLTVLENTAQSDFIEKLMAAEGQMPGHPWNAAKPVASWYASKGDPIPNGLQQYDIPYGDRKYLRAAEADLQYVQPNPPSMRIMAPQVKGSDVPGATADAAFQPGTSLMPASDVTGRIDAAMLQNVPPPQNTQTVAISPEARGTNTSFSGFGSSGRNQPPPQAS